MAIRMSPGTRPAVAAAPAGAASRSTTCPERSVQVAPSSGSVQPPFRRRLMTPRAASPAAARIHSQPLPRRCSAIVAMSPLLTARRPAFLLASIPAVRERLSIESQQDGYHWVTDPLPGSHPSWCATYAGGVEAGGLSDPTFRIGPGEIPDIGFRGRLPPARGSTPRRPSGVMSWGRGRDSEPDGDSPGDSIVRQEQAASDGIFIFPVGVLLPVPLPGQEHAPPRLPELKEIKCLGDLQREGRCAQRLGRHV